jgi:hypothetical protein
MSHQGERSIWLEKGARVVEKEGRMAEKEGWMVEK